MVDSSSGGEVPRGFKLRHTLRVDQAVVTRLAWSPDGRMLASGAGDSVVRIWDAETGEAQKKIPTGQTDIVYSVAWSRDGLLASGAGDRTIRVWRPETGEQCLTLQGYGHDDRVFRVAWSPDGQTLASGSADNSIRLWDAKTGKWTGGHYGHYAGVNDLAWSPDGRRLASGSYDQWVRMWSVAKRELGWEQLLWQNKGHTAFVSSLAWSPDPDRRMLASGAEDSIIQIWDPESGRPMFRLEGHTGSITGVAFSADSQLLASKSKDNTVRLWRTDRWETVAILDEVHSTWWEPGLAFHPKRPILATLGERDTIVRIWELDLEILLGETSAAGKPTRAVYHTTAKVVLVGDSGVGKTGLGWRLVHGTYKEHDSTHGQQFWVLEPLKHTRGDGAKCEAVLWDFAGQPDFRLIHTLFLDDADLALVLFNPANRQEPLHGVDFWLKALAHGRERPCRAILVGARIDVGELALTPDEIDAFCRDRGISGGYVATSAKRGVGLDELIKRVKGQIGWDTMNATVTTDTFKRIKDFVLRLKEGPERTDVLADPDDLQRKLQATDPEWRFSDDEMMAAVANLANYGYVRVLRTSGSERCILLAPELLNNLAASIVLEARRNPRGLGALDEGRLLKGEYRFPELDGLDERDRQTLLDAATMLFLGHNTCFRETHEPDTYLIFPELINQKKPRLDEEVEPENDVSYSVSGDVANAYAALVVLLGYTNVFTRTHQWQDQARYVMGEREVCGFRQQTTGFEGEAEYVLYYGQDVGQPTRDLFRGLFERFLLRRRVQVTRYPPVVCQKCGYRQGREEVVRQVRDRRPAMFCSKCGKKINLAGVGEVITPGRIVHGPIEQERAVADLRTRYEAALVTVKSLARKKRRKKPTCFISYAWGVREHEEWIEKRLARDLQNAGVEVILDRWHNSAIGSSVPRFISLLEVRETLIVVVGTPLYRQKYENKVSTTGSVVAAEVDLINLRLIGTEQEKKTVLPVLLDGDERTSFPPLMRGRVFADIQREEAYFPTLFKLILTLYGIPFEGPEVAELRESLTPGSFHS